MQGVSAISARPHLLLSALLSLLVAGAYLALPLLTFAIALGAALFLLLLLAWPVIGLYGAAFSLVIITAGYFKHVDGFTVHYFLFQAFLVCTLFAFLVHAIARKEPLGIKSPFTKIMLGILLFESLGLFWVSKPDFGREHVIAVLSNVLLFYLMVRLVDTPGKLLGLAVALILGALHASAWLIVSDYYEEYNYTLYLTASTGWTFHLYTLRPGGLGGSNYIAGFLISSSLVCGALCVSFRNNWAKALMLALGLYLFSVSMLTGSRGALLGIVGGVSLFLALHPRMRQAIIKKFTLFSIVTLVSILLLSPGFLDRLLVGFGYTGELLFSTKKKSASSSAANVTMEERYEWWLTGYEAMQKPPERLLVGLGPGGFMNSTKALGVHNLYLAFFFDMGLPGAVILITAAYVVLEKNRRIGLRHDGTLVKNLYNAALIALLSDAAIHGLVDYDLTAPVSRFIVLDVALLATSVRLLDMRDEAERERGEAGLA